MSAKNDVLLCFPGIKTNFSISSEKLTNATRQGSSLSRGSPAHEAEHGPLSRLSGRFRLPLVHPLLPLPVGPESHICKGLVEKRL